MMSQVILLIIAILVGSAVLIWLWKGPIRKFVQSMKKSGSSAFEAYTIVILLTGGIVFAIYMIVQVL